MAKVIMVQGTMSGAGKSLVVAGLCRVFRQDGYRVAPFKSQNMALNSYVTSNGDEMGRAQVMQAEAAKIEPKVCMNPVLLKPTSDKGSQVIVNGKVLGNMQAREYFAYKKSLIPEIKQAFMELSKDVDIIVIEGAGSPAEINLKNEDIVNMGMAALVDAPVILVGDIDRGGVFAQLLGTLMLLEEDEKDRIKGLVINKFRGDKTILDPGIDMLTEKCGKPVCGVLPYINLKIDDEDSLTSRFDNNEKALINIAVIRLPRISNISDYTCFEQMDNVAVHYVESPQEIEGMDLVIIPGSKNTIGDLKWLRASGMEAAIKKYSESGIVFGICGGYQMLGNMIEDPECVEEGGSIRGMELLPMVTVLTDSKTTTRVAGRIENIDGPLALLKGKELEGYEIHMGLSKRTDDSSGGLARLHVLADTNENNEYIDGINSGNVYGSYIHGFFDAGDIASDIIGVLAERKGLSLACDAATDYRAFKESQYDKLADMIREYMDMDMIYAMLNEAKI